MHESPASLLPSSILRCNATITPTARVEGEGEARIWGQDQRLLCQGYTTDNFCSAQTGGRTAMVTLGCACAWCNGDALVVSRVQDDRRKGPGPRQSCSSLSRLVERARPFRFPAVVCLSCVEALTQARSVIKPRPSRWAPGIRESPRVGATNGRFVACA